MIPGIRIVVRRRFCGLIPEIPAAFINRATRFRPTQTSCSRRSSAWILGAPYTPRLCSWICLIFSVSHASVSALSDGAPSPGACAKPPRSAEINAYKPTPGSTRT